MTDTLPTKEEFDNIRRSYEGCEKHSVHQLLSIIDAYGKAVREMQATPSHLIGVGGMYDHVMFIDKDSVDNLRSLSERYGRKV